MNADDSLRKAADRLDKIHDEIEVLQHEAREIETAISVMRRFGAEVSADDDAVRPEPQKETDVRELFIPRPSPRPQSEHQQGMSQAEFEILAARFIEDAARPLTRTEILTRLAASGKSLGAIGDASKNAGTKLWRAREKFVNIRGAGYWLKDRPLPALGYTPNPMTPEQDYDPDFPKEPAGGMSELEKEAETLSRQAEDRTFSMRLR